MDILKNHPALDLANWLKTSRQHKGIVKRVFAVKIGLTPAQYTELEAGVARWIGDTQREAIAAVLELTGEQLQRFTKMVKLAQQAFALSFSNLFTRQDLEPMRFRFNDRF